MFLKLKYVLNAILLPGTPSYNSMSEESNLMNGTALYKFFIIKFFK